MKAKRRPIRKANGRFAGSRSISKLPYSDVYITNKPRKVPNSGASSLPMYQPATPKHEKRFAIAGMTTVTTAATLTALHVGAGGVGSLITAGVLVIPVVAMFGAIFLVKGTGKKTND